MLILYFYKWILLSYLLNTGGMIACHVANTHSVDLLVCDRTFASLDAVAARLLGQVRAYLYFTVESEDAQ